MIKNNIILKTLEKNKISNITNNNIFFLSQYLNLLLDWNNKIKLISTNKIDEILLNHVVDSLQLIQLNLVSQYETILDIGTGAGFPGLIIGIFSNKKITLIESNLKKVIFLKHVKYQLKLDNITILHERAENISHNYNYREKFDCAVSRALSNFMIAMELSFPFVKVGGNIMYYATKNTVNAIKKNFSKIKQFGCENFELLPYFLKNSIYYIFNVKKLWKTPEKYPRTYNKLKRNKL